MCIRDRSEPETQIVEYADWALRKFFEEARKQPWFDNTIFVLEGDHGLSLIHIYLFIKVCQ